MNKYKRITRHIFDICRKYESTHAKNKRLYYGNSYLTKENKK